MQQLIQSVHPQGREERKEEMVTITKTEYEKLKKEAAEYLDGWKRAKADYINFKRETVERQAEVAQFATMGMLVELIPVYDHLQRAVKSVAGEKQTDPWVEGVVKIRQEFEKFLRDAGVEAMQVEGKQFDPTQHEALGSERKEGMAPNMVLREVRAGYTLRGNVLMPAQVIVSREREESETKDENEKVD